MLQVLAPKSLKSNHFNKWLLLIHYSQTIYSASVYQAGDDQARS